MFIAVTLTVAIGFPRSDWGGYNTNKCQRYCIIFNVSNSADKAKDIPVTPGNK